MFAERSNEWICRRRRTHLPASSRFPKINDVFLVMFTFSVGFPIRWNVHKWYNSYCSIQSVRCSFPCRCRLVGRCEADSGTWYENIYLWFYLQSPSAIVAHSRRRRRRHSTPPSTLLRSRKTCEFRGFHWNGRRPWPHSPTCKYKENRSTELLTNFKNEYAIVSFGTAPLHRKTQNIEL